MNKSILNVVGAAAVAVVLGLAVSCNDEPADNSGDNGNMEKPVVAPVTTAKIDTLCAYSPSSYKNGKFVFKNDEELTAFLGSTTLDTIKDMAHQPDFKQWTYFAWAGSGSPRDIGVSYGEDTVTVKYVGNYPPECTTQPCIAFSPPPPIIIVYFIPFTDKAVKFEEVAQIVGENGE